MDSQNQIGGIVFIVLILLFGSWPLVAYIQREKKQNGGKRKVKKCKK